MITTKKELKDCLKKEKEIYSEPNLKKYLLRLLINGEMRNIWRYQKALRKTEYYYNTRKRFLNGLLYLWYCRRKNSLGIKLGIEIQKNCFDKGLIIYHFGNIVVNPAASIGENCKLHGDNCIGNDGTNETAPRIGNNVDIGVGAKIIGDVYIADNIKIGAGAVVVKSFYEEGITIAGVPARKIK